MSYMVKRPLTESDRQFLAKKLLPSDEEVRQATDDLFMNLLTRADSLETAADSLDARADSLETAATGADALLLSLALRINALEDKLKG